MLIDIIAGARPNFMKIAPIIRALDARRAAGGPLRYRLVHTGQHYDARMSGDFFAQLGIPAPDVNLEVGSGTQAEQTAAIMVRYEKLLLDARSELCLVVGDVTSTMACAIAAQKLCVPVAHVEGGMRSGDWTMPEEINRMVTDAITQWFFTTSEVANANLRRAGVADERIFFVGNTMIDTLLANMNRLQKPPFWDELRLIAGEYFVLTLHRPANVDAERTLAAMLTAIGAGARGLPVVFPVHPRTARTLQALGGLPANLCLVEPQPYLEFNYLVKHAKAVLTDSGGITEETTVLGVPCMTLRDTTERPETISTGTNELLGTDPAALAPALLRLFAGEWKKGGIPEKWDGRTGERIVAALETLLAARRAGEATYLISQEMHVSLYPIREAQRARIPAVTHVDGSGRLQTVTRDTNPRDYALIEAFRKLTGVPMVLNTSFNENEPVVCTPQEALDCFLRTKMDLLVMGKWVVGRKG